MNCFDSSYEAYEQEYNSTGRLYSGSTFKIPNRTLNTKQLKTAYQTHVRKIKRIEQKKEQTRIDTEETLDFILREKCLNRDKRCQVVQIFNDSEFKEYSHSVGLFYWWGLSALDCAHVFGKGAFPHMRYVMDNVVMLNRVSHNWLDTGKSPVNGKQISNEEKINWWKRIIGEERYKLLEKMSRFL